MNILPIVRRAAPAFMATAILSGSAPSMPAAADSLLAVGPRSLQSLVVAQLFDRAGRWYLIDDGGCYTYLESPQTRIALQRVVLRAHLSSRLGQSVGKDCLGADLASDVTVSGKLHGSGHALVLDDIRIDRVDDESARSALNLALQVDPQMLPHAASIDISDFMRRNVSGAAASPVRLEEFRIVSIGTRADAVVMHFDLDLRAP